MEKNDELDQTKRLEKQIKMKEDILNFSKRSKSREMSATRKFDQTKASQNDLRPQTGTNKKDSVLKADTEKPKTAMSDHEKRKYMQT